MAAAAMAMNTSYTNPFPPQQQISPPRSQPASPLISRKPLPEPPSHNHTSSTTNTTSCPSCGQNMTSSDANSAQRMILDLQAQVKLLNSKAAAAADKLADYEDEVRTLRTERQQREEAASTTANNSGIQSINTSPQRVAALQQQSQISRLGSLRSFLGGSQRSNPSDSAIDTTGTSGYAFGGALFSASQPSLPLPNQPPEPTLHSLQSDLATERTLREKAEASLTQTQMELEELTASLFGQANEMVAEERRARSKLEERVRVLEKREREKGERLKRLEGRVERVERVRAMVG